MKKHQPLKSRLFITTLLSCLALSGVVQTAHAAGLGKIVVFSALGQPLRAEIEVTVTRDELSGMQAQLSSPETFKQAGLDYASSLVLIQSLLDKRPNGQSIIKLSSSKPINDPFIDMLIELNWPAGRVTREYTVLLDPVGIAGKHTSSVAPAETKEVTSRLPSEKTDSTSTQKTPEESTQQPSSYEIKRGDALVNLARKTKPEGVSLEQMMIGLLRSNPGSFDGGNMHRLKVGKTLSTPEPSELKALSTEDARKVIIAQSHEWDTYRRKLSTAAVQSQAAPEDAGRQDSSGKITAKVEDNSASAHAPKNDVKISRTEKVGAKKGNRSAQKHSEEELIAKDKALQETNERIASLENNIMSLQKLVDLKNQQLADLEKQSSTQETSPLTSAPTENLATSAGTGSAPELIEKSMVPLPSSPPELKSTAKPEQKPIDSQKPVAKEPSLITNLADSPLAWSAAGILALIAAYFLYKRRH